MVSARQTSRRHSALLGVAASAAVLAGTRSFVGLPVTSKTAAGRTQLRAYPTGPAAGKISLSYFDGKGVVETARMLFAVAGEDFEDKRYPISFGVPFDFSTVKRDEFVADQQSGALDVAMGKIPVLEAGPDFKLPQSKAIERYVSKRLGLMGSTLEEEAWADALAEHVRDISTAFNSKGTFMMKDEEKKAEIQKKWFEEELPTWLSKLEKAVPGTDGYAVGGKTTLADVAIYKLLKDTYPNDVSGAYDSCEKLKAIVAKLDAHEGLQKWIQGRKETLF